MTRTALARLVPVGLALAVTISANPAVADVAPPAGDISGGGARPFDPASCATSQTVGMSVGDLLSCLLPEPQSGPASGVPDGMSPDQFTPAPGVDYTPVHGSVPAHLALPPGCTDSVRGTWTQDQGVVEAVSRVGDRTVFEVLLSSHWTSGFGAGGRAIFHGDMWTEPAGFAVVVGREMFQGTIGGRTGSVVGWAVANPYATGRFVAHEYSTHGTNGLAPLRFESDGVGFLGKGGHWTQPGRGCFAD